MLGQNLYLGAKIKLLSSVNTDDTSSTETMRAEKNLLVSANTDYSEQSKNM